MEKLYLDKEKTLVNLSNSILKYFNIDTFHPSLKEADEILAKSNKKKVALVLFDGYGKNIFNIYKESTPFIATHYKFDMLSVFPPTTVAATTSLTTAKYPIETAHLGWIQHFKKYNSEIVVFISNDKFDGTHFYYPHVQSDILKPHYIWQLINESQKYNATSISSYEVKTKAREDDMDAFFERADDAILNHDFSYLYSSYPDHLLHLYGCSSEEVRKNIIFLERKLKELISKHPDTLFLLIADHGFKDCEEISIREHKDFLATLSKDYFLIEPTFAGFYVKDKANFEKLAKKYYGDKFLIYPKQELLDSHLLGYGEINPLTLDTLCDYFLISISKYSFYDGDEPVGFKGVHAGGNKEEREICLFAFND